MKFFKKRSVAVVVLVLAILASCAYGLYKKPADQLNVQYGTWLLDGAGVLSADTEQTIGDYNQKWDSSYRAVIAVASTDDIHGWTAEKYAKTLGKSWGLGANDMLLLIVKGGDYYVALGDALNQSLTDTQIAKLQSAIETPYYQGDCDGAATAFFRQADVVLAQVMQSGGSSYSGGYSESYNGGWVDSSGASVSSASPPDSLCPAAASTLSTMLSSGIASVAPPSGAISHSSSPRCTYSPSATHSCASSPSAV
mgnify:CR=1 FL=1